MQGVRNLLVLIVGVLAFGTSVLRAGNEDFGDDAYTLPLVGGYAVHRNGSSNSGDQQGTFQLIEMMNPPTSVGFTYIVPVLEQVAVVQKLILGRAKKGLFILDSSQSHLEAAFFDSPEKWRAALASNGVAADVQLSNPDTLAANVPEQVLRPWEFRVMHGWFGLSDDVWSLVVQGLGLLIALVAGFLTPLKRSPMVTAVVLGIAIDLLAMMVIAGEGPGTFVGLIEFPIIFYVAALIGKLVRRLIRVVRKPSVPQPVT